MRDYFSDESKTTPVAGYSLYRLHSFCDGKLVSSEIMLPTGKSTAAYVNQLRKQAESEYQQRGEETVGEKSEPLNDKSAQAAPKPQEVTPVDASAAADDDTGPVYQQVPCLYKEDVIAQQKAAESNIKYGERDRTNAVKAVTKALLARPMTRSVGVPLDIHAAMQKLQELVPHMPELVQALQIPLLVAAQNGAPPVVPPMLLVGAPGVGKSYIALQIADLLGVPTHTVSYAANGSVGNVLSGSDKHWGNSSTGIVFNALTQGEYANPVICLDEIDKAASSSSTSGIDRNPLNELLALLEPVTAKAHMDRCAEIRVDARHIVWVATANSLTGLSPALLSRFRIILVNKPDARAAVAIALSVTQSVSVQMGVTIKPPSGEVLQWLATLTPRMMRRVWTAAAGCAASDRRDRVTMNDIEQAVGLGGAGQTRLH